MYLSYFLYPHIFVCHRHPILSPEGELRLVLKAPIEQNRLSSTSTPGAGLCPSLLTNIFMVLVSRFCERQGEEAKNEKHPI